MEINKQLFEDVLSDKLKGTFVLRNGSIISSDGLRQAQQNKVIAARSYPYILEGECYCYYTENGWYINDYIYHNLDIIDFIPDTDMETKELKIQIPEGYCIDESKSTFEKIVFKKKENTKPRSWEEYCFQRNESEEKGFYINEDSGIESSKWPGIRFKCFDYWRNVLPSKELAEAFLAMMQLVSLRQAWIGDWKPNYDMNMASNWTMEYHPNPGKWEVENHCWTNGGGLTFPTKEMATDFMNTFKNLLDVAKPLV